MNDERVHYEVTVNVEGREPYVHRCSAGAGPNSMSAACEFAVQVMLLGRDRSDFVGKKIICTAEVYEPADG